MQWLRLDDSVLATMEREAISFIIGAGVGVIANSLLVIRTLNPWREGI